MIETIVFYIVCASISYLGIKYKHIFSDGFRHKGIGDKDWLFILLPIVNCFTVAFTIIIVIFGVGAKIDDYIRK